MDHSEKIFENVNRTDLRTESRQGLVNRVLHFMFHKGGAWLDKQILSLYGRCWKVLVWKLIIGQPKKNLSRILKFRNNSM